MIDGDLFAAFSRHFTMWITRRQWRIFIEKSIPLKQRWDGKENIIDQQGFFPANAFRYSTGSDIIQGANLIHEFYAHETRNPVYILVDTSLKNDASFQIKAYIGYTFILLSISFSFFSSVPFGVKDKDKLKSHGTIFTPIPVRIVTYDEEKAASNARESMRNER